MKLIKLQDKFILVNDEEIKVNDWYLFKDDANQWHIHTNNGTESIPSSERFRKIISEIPDFSLLSEEDCKTIGFVDVEKLALKYSSDFIKDKHLIGLQIAAYLEGYEKAQSLNDKMFSDENMRKAIEMAQRAILDSSKIGISTHTIEEIIQSLQQTSWDVEVEMEEKIHNDVVFEDGSFNKYPYYKKPKITNNSIKIIKIL